MSRRFTCVVTYVQMLGIYGLVRPRHRRTSANPCGMPGGLFDPDEPIHCLAQASINRAEPLDNRKLARPRAQRAVWIATALSRPGRLLVLQDIGDPGTDARLSVKSLAPDVPGSSSQGPGPPDRRSSCHRPHRPVPASFARRICVPASARRRAHSSASVMPPRLFQHSVPGRRHQMACSTGRKRRLRAHWPARPVRSWP